MLVGLVRNLRMYLIWTYLFPVKDFTLTTNFTMLVLRRSYTFQIWTYMRIFLIKNFTNISWWWIKFSFSLILISIASTCSFKKLRYLLSIERGHLHNLKTLSKSSLISCDPFTHIKQRLLPFLFRRSSLGRNWGFIWRFIPYSFKFSLRRI